MRRKITKSLNKFDNEQDAKKFYDAFVDPKTNLPKTSGPIRYIHVAMTYRRENGPDSPKVYTVEVWSK